MALSRLHRILVPSLVGSVALLGYGCSSQSVVLSSCLTASKAPTITLKDIIPAPRIRVPVGTALVVLEPPYWLRDTEVQVTDGKVLKEQCSVSLSNHGRRTIFTALRPGTSGLSATITPPQPFSPGWDLNMPGWLGTVIVVH